MAADVKAAPKAETPEQELARLRAENAALKQQQQRKVSFKVSEKGALSLYGMGRFPITLYAEQWLRVLDMAQDIRAFIAANAKTLRQKGDPLPETASEPVLPANPTPAQIAEFKTAMTAWLAKQPK